MVGGSAQGPAPKRPIGRDWRYNAVDLRVVRSLSGEGLVTLYLRTYGRAWASDRKLGWATIPLPPGSPESVDPLLALAAALKAVAALQAGQGGPAPSTPR